MDTIKLFGAEPANFLDVGGGATAEKVTGSIQADVTESEAKSNFSEYFWWNYAVRCNCCWCSSSSREVDLQVPLVVRMKGTNEKKSEKILADSNLAIIPADNMSEAAEKVVQAIKG